ncbi:hypothetical protein Scep_007514 [Stephania cephalantha]|uniref:Tetraspanin-19-like n=1 Tax=Stephania cephalantha TaxID=152367 RepID=A0AAP0KCR4_9MAGN
MVKCIKCFLRSSIRAINLVVILFGLAMIIYSLWLLKRWFTGFKDISSTSTFPTPWFIYVCLGVGIVVCLSMLSGHVVANKISFRTLLTYIVAVCFILLIQAGLIVWIFINMNWEAKIAEYISMDDEDFKNFLDFQISLCRYFTFFVVFAEISALLPAIVLLKVGPEPRSRCSCSSSDNEPDDQRLKQSFLVRSSSTLLVVSNS